MTDLLDFDTDNLRRIGYGSSRHVLELSPYYVVKISAPHSPFGNEPNEWETETYARALDEGWHESLTEVVAWADDHSWIICERITPLPSEDRMSEDMQDQWLALCSFLSERGIEDLHSCNFGTRDNGEVVCLDFAT